MEFINHLEGLISDKLTIVKDLWTLFKLEARLAGLTIFPLLIVLGMLISMIFTLVITSMLLIGLLITKYTGEPLFAVGYILVANLFILLYLLLNLKKRLRQMSFAKIRSCLNSPLRDAYEFKKKTSDHDSPDRARG